MLKSTIPMGEVETFVRQLAQEVGVHVLEKAGYLQVKADNGHRINIQRSKVLGHVDTTLDVLGQEGTLPLKNGPGSNGAIMARIEPKLELLERYIRMLPSAEAAKKARGPKPFAVRQTVAPRIPNPVVAPAPKPTTPPELQRRLDLVAERARKAKARRLMEEQGLDEETAWAVAEGKIDMGDVVISDEVRGLLNGGVVEVEQ